jgi:hypothetical protein
MVGIILIIKSLIILKNNVNSKNYLTLLSDAVQPTMQYFFPNQEGYFQDDNAPIHRTNCVLDWFDEHDTEFKHLE